MNIIDLLRDDLVAPNLKAGSKKEMLQEMLEAVQAKGLLRNLDTILTLLVKREELMSTGIGHGFAIPHAFTNEVEESFLMIGKVPEGADYDALDGKPVYYLLLLLGPLSSQGKHLKTLSRLSRIITRPGIEESLATCSEPSDFLRVFREFEEKVRLD